MPLFLLILTAFFFVFGGTWFLATVWEELEAAYKVLVVGGHQYDKDYLKDRMPQYIIAVVLLAGLVFSGNALLKDFASMNAINQQEADARRNEIYNQGMAAAEAGIPDTACPYRQSGGRYASNSPDERAWLEGWIAKTSEINKAKENNK